MATRCAGGFGGAAGFLGRPLGGVGAVGRQAVEVRWPAAGYQRLRASRFRASPACAYLSIKLPTLPVPRFGFYIFLLLLSTLVLGSCTLLHPRRIPNPKTPAEVKAKRKAARKAQKNAAKASQSTNKPRRKNKEQETDDSAGAAPGADPAAATAPTADAQAATTLPDKSTLKYYKKTGLMKKPDMKRLRYYKIKPARKPFRPLHAIRSLFRKKPKRHEKDSAKPAPDQPLKAEPAPAPVDTGLTP